MIAAGERVEPMIISHRYKFIFLKTEKTASSSLHAALRKIVEANDTLHVADRGVRRRLLREHGSLDGLSFIGAPQGRRAWFPGFSGLHHHARARHVRAFVGRDLFSRYTIITSERNPYDRQVSLFNHRSRRRGNADLTGFSRAMESPLYNMLHHNRLHNWEIYAIDGKVCADHVIRFEHLKDDFRMVLDRLGIDAERYPLGHLRDGRRPAAGEYRQFYTDEARRLVASWYRREIQHFGYEF